MNEDAPLIGLNNCQLIALSGLRGEGGDATEAGSDGASPVLSLKSGWAIAVAIPFASTNA